MGQLRGKGPKNLDAGTGKQLLAENWRSRVIRDSPW
jgi:hypothetical protein